MKSASSLQAQPHNEAQMTECPILHQKGASSRRVLSRYLSTFLALVSMSFDGLRTVKADDNDTALEGTLIRYGNASAQIAFATGTLECTGQAPLMMRGPFVYCRYWWHSKIHTSTHSVQAFLAAGI